MDPIGINREKRGLKSKIYWKQPADRLPTQRPATVCLTFLDRTSQVPFHFL